MDSNYVPAIITGITGIAGIMINVSVNTWYRFSDIKEKRKEKNIAAYENFYVPLCSKLLLLQYTINSLLNLEANLDLKKILECLKKGNSPANLRTSIDDIFKAAKDVDQFVKTNPYKYIADYKTKIYYDRIMELITAICRSKENSESFPDLAFKLEYIEKL